MATAAQQEFEALVASGSGRRHDIHPDDVAQANDSSADEETVYRNGQIKTAMSLPTDSADFKLPPASFDCGRATGVKGVIADARAFQTARKSKRNDRLKPTPQSGNSIAAAASREAAAAGSPDSGLDESLADLSDEETFLQQWRESRRRELEKEATRAVRNRRTSPSVRVYGRLDEVDALGYLDAIERVGRETKVVVFVYDNECQVSAAIESALLPLVKANPSLHFVKIHYDQIEFDPAAVPALLVYRNQGDLFANLTGIIEMMPDNEIFGTDALKGILQKHNVL